MSVNQTSVNKMSVNQMTVNQMSVNQMSVNQMCVNQMSVKQMPVNQTHLDQISVNQTSFDQMSIDQMSGDQKVFDEMVRNPINQLICDSSNPGTYSIKLFTLVRGKLKTLISTSIICGKSQCINDDGLHTLTTNVRLG